MVIPTFDWFRPFTSWLDGIDEHAGLTQPLSFIRRLSTEGSQTSQVEAYLGEPVQLHYRIPDPNDRDWALLREYDRGGYMEVQCTVTEEGTVEDLEIVDGRLPFDLRHSVMRSMQFSRYRPRLADGEPVATHGVRVRQAYPADGFVASFQVDVAIISARESEPYRSVARPRF
jgi:Gram-negative bacterial TonB protein C-terminal